MYNSIFEQKYIFPILKSKKLQIFVIRPDHYQTLLMMEKILRMIELNVQEPFGYEFEIRSELSRFWCMLLAETETIRSQNIETNGVDIERVKTMMQYIHGTSDTGQYCKCGKYQQPRMRTVFPALYWNISRQLPE